MKVNEYVNKNTDTIVKEISEVLKIPSISTSKDHKKNIENCANWLKNYMKNIGLENVKIMPTKGWPVVYGDYIKDKSLPTVLVYGHYDVQPPEPLDKWNTKPFEPTIKNGKLYARGSADDKGQFMIHLLAVKYYLQEIGELPVNVKFFIEGEEEIGSENLEPFIKNNKDLLKADFALVSDSHMLSPTQPAIDYGLRGLAYFEINVEGPENDVHSGLYGGAIQNPANALAQIISKLKDENGKVLIPGIYDKVRNVDKEERKYLQDQVTKEDIIKETGIDEPFGEKGYSLAERVGARPSLDVHGIWGGFQDGGSKTIIPAKSGCKVSIRTVPNIKAKELEKMFKSYIKEITPQAVTVDVKTLNLADPYLVDYRKPVMQKAGKVLEEVFGNEPEFLLSGGSIPVTELIERHLGIKTVLMGFGLPDDNLHGPNEKMDLDQILNGIEASVKYLEEVGKG